MQTPPPDFQKIFSVLEPRRRRRFRKENSDGHHLTVDDDAFNNLAVSIAGRMHDGQRGHEVSQLAVLVVEATGGQWDRPRALHWLMNSRNGSATLHRLRGAIGKALVQKEKPMDRMETLETFVKSCDGNMLTIAKAITDGTVEATLTEAEFTKLATEAALRAYPGERPDQAFAKYFEGHEVVRRAHAIVKGVLIIKPVSIGDEGNDDDDENALEQLQTLAEAQRARSPELTKAQAFSKVYLDPANRALVRRERQQAYARMG
jgi:hypothetical protein